MNFINLSRIFKFIEFIFGYMKDNGVKIILITKKEKNIAVVSI